MACEQPVSLRPFHPNLADREPNSPTDPARASGEFAHDHRPGNGSLDLLTPQSIYNKQSPIPSPPLSIHHSLNLMLLTIENTNLTSGLKE